jgi:putative hydrolase of the HAD superfamily
MIRAVVFDLFETLITESRVPPTRASSLGDALKLEREAFRVEWKARRPRVVLGQLSFGEALTDISRALTGRVDAAAVQRVCEQRIREKALAFAELDEEVAALIGELRRMDLALAVVSNCFAGDVSAWSRWPLAREFQCAVFSFAAGVAKPDPEIYLKATRALRAEPEATVFVGDGGDEELVGAERAGLRALRAAWFQRRWAHFTASNGREVGLANPLDVLTFVAAAS